MRILVVGIMAFALLGCVGCVKMTPEARNALVGEGEDLCEVLVDVFAGPEYVIACKGAELLVKGALDRAIAAPPVPSPARHVEPGGVRPSLYAKHRGKRRRVGYAPPHIAPRMQASLDTIP